MQHVVIFSVGTCTWHDVVDRRKGAYIINHSEHDKVKNSMILALSRG